MTSFRITGLPDSLTGEVRITLLSPGYGHPVLREIARGTGPCRACLDQFKVGEDERLLFTYRPDGGETGLGAPGPVFIHAGECPQYLGDGFPEGIRSLPLFFEARASEGRVVATRRASGDSIEGVIEELLADDQATHLHVRHGEAGCHIAKVERV